MKVNFKGILLSSIKLSPMSKTLYRVMASAPHAWAIETGQPEQRGKITFEEQPALKDWVRNKLMAKDPKKAAYFLRIGAVIVGETGFPYGMPQGLQFMFLGFEYARIMSNHILSQELNKLGTGGLLTKSFGTGFSSVKISQIGEIV